MLDDNGCPFFHAAGQENIQQILRVRFLLQGLHEQRVPCFLRRLRGVFLFPAFQQMQVIAQYPETFLLRLPVAQFLADFSLDRKSVV